MDRMFDLAQKEVINIETGTAMGRAQDIEIDTQSGRITAIVIPGKIKAYGLLGREPDTVIPWEMVKRVGNDAILVKLSDKKD